jgi:7-keto-8-aminopelargonate synthetase-like enzyme
MMHEGLQAAGYDTGVSETPIIPIHCRDVMKTLVMTKRLEAEGIFVNPVVPPAVPPNGALIRISLMATHTESQIAYALEKITEVGRELGVLNGVLTVSKTDK